MSYGNSLFIFLRNCQTVFYSRSIILHSHQQFMRLPITLHSIQHLLNILKIINIGILGNLKQHHTVVWFAFLKWLMKLPSFCVIVGHFYIFFGEIAIEVISPFFSIGLSFAVELLEFFNILNTKALPDLWYTHTFSHSVGHLFAFFRVL